jgi:hypothetical protein
MRIQCISILTGRSWGCFLSPHPHGDLENEFFFINKCPASPEKEDQRAAGSPAALTQLALCLRLAPDLKGRKWQRAVTLNDS